MADSSVPITAGSGTAIDVETVTTGVGTVNRQVVALGDPATGGQRLTISAAGAAKVDGSAVTQPVSAASLPLPTGAALEAGHIATVDTSTAALNTAVGAQADAAVTTAVAGSLLGYVRALKEAFLARIPTLGQKAKSGALPISFASDQVGAAGTAAADVLSVQGIALMTPLKVDGSAVTQPVSGTVAVNAGTNLNTSLLALEAGGNLAAILADTADIEAGIGAVGDTADATGTSGTASAIGLLRGVVQNVARIIVGTSDAIARSALGMVLGSGVNPGGSVDALRTLSATGTGLGVAKVAGGSVYSQTPVTPADGDYTVLRGDAAGRVRLVVEGAPGADYVADTQKVEQRFAYTHLAANATTTIKSTPGFLHAIVINTKGATANTLTVYDNTAGSGAVIAIIDTTAQVGRLEFNLSTFTGLTLVMASGTAADITVLWR